MTYKQIMNKVACPTCGAPRGMACGTGAGRLRMEAHRDRASKAQTMMGVSGSAFGNLMRTLGLKK
jgi:hypothetical protein